MKLLKSRFFLIAFLPNILFALLLLLQALTTGKLADSAMYAADIFKESGALETFILGRKVLLLGYILGGIYLAFEHLNLKKKSKKVLVRSFVILGVGALISQFTLFLAMFTYDILSKILGAF